MRSDVAAAFLSINTVAATPAYAGVSTISLDGLSFENGIAETIVINVTSGFQVSDRLDIAGDASDLIGMRWDTDSDFANGYQGQVKFYSGGAIVPQGGLTPGNVVHLAGDINSSGGGSTPPFPYPQGPRFDNGQGTLVDGSSDFSGGGFFTGYARPGRGNGRLLVGTVAALAATLVLVGGPGRRFARHSRAGPVARRDGPWSTNRQQS